MEVHYSVVLTDVGDVVSLLLALLQEKQALWVAAERRIVGAHGEHEGATDEHGDDATQDH